MQDADGNDRPAYYWELEREDRLLAAPFLVEEEGYAAVYINNGRRMLALANPFESLPDIVSLGDQPESQRLDDPWTYAVPVAMLLAAAVYENVPIDAVVNQARDIQRLVEWESLDAARERELSMGGSASRSTTP